MSFPGSVGTPSSEVPSLEAPALEVLVQLLDAALGRVLKTWAFRGRPSISIGRQRECDVEINDPYVSRLHAEFQFRDGAWAMISRGRNGIIVSNQRVEEMAIQSEVTFQLGSAGPLLRFALEHQDSVLGNTLCFDTQPAPAFALDQKQLREEVGQIADADDFQRLREQAKRLRARRDNS